MAATPVVKAPAPVAAGPDALQASITKAQVHLRSEPGDWDAWATLGSAYVQEARITADPSYYPKAEGALNRSLQLRPDGNVSAMVGHGRSDGRPPRVHRLPRVGHARAGGCARHRGCVRGASTTR